MGIWKFLKFPLNDVVTSPDVVLEFHSRSIEPYCKERHRLQQQLHPDVAALCLDSNKELILKHILELIQEDKHLTLSWLDKELGQIEMVAKTDLLKFKDDVLILVQESNPRSFVHMRSKSRLGKSDLGKNADRIKTFFNLLRTRLETKKVSNDESPP